MYQPEDYLRDRGWEGSFSSEVIDIITPLMHHIAKFCLASDYNDRKNARDFDLQLKGGAVACRLRRPFYDKRDLTIRSFRLDHESGARLKTELAKIKEGRAPSRYFYGWTDDSGKIPEWMLVDMDKVSAKGMLEGREEKPNKDGVTGFIWIPSTELHEAGCVLAYNQPQQRNVKVQVSQEDRDEGNRRANHRKYYGAKIKDTNASQPGLWEMAL
jgi:nuclear transport factor 2 (NTF2) superfamily protein